MNRARAAVTDKMSLTPVSREEMRKMKGNVDEQRRLQLIDTIVSQIYAPTVRQAQSSSETSYSYELTNTTYHNHGLHKSQEVKANMPDILNRLRELFPGCRVTHATLAKGQDGKIYDIACIEEKVLAFVNREQTQEYIVVDWS